MVNLGPDAMKFHFKSIKTELTTVLLLSLPSVERRYFFVHVELPVSLCSVVIAMFAIPNVFIIFNVKKIFDVNRILKWHFKLKGHLQCKTQFSQLSKWNALDSLQAQLNVLVIPRKHLLLVFCFEKKKNVKKMIRFSLTSVKDDVSLVEPSFFANKLKFRHNKQLLIPIPMVL